MVGGPETLLMDDIGLFGGRLLRSHFPGPIAFHSKIRGCGLTRGG